MPDMLAEFCAESLVWVSERRLMARVSGLKRVLSKAYIGLGWPVALRCHCCLVDHGSHFRPHFHPVVKVEFESSGVMLNPFPLFCIFGNTST